MVAPRHRLHREAFDAGRGLMPPNARQHRPGRFANLVGGVQAQRDAADIGLVRQVG